MAVKTEAKRSARPIPMLAAPVDDVPTGAGWSAEPKIDGWRCLARRTEDGVELMTRSGKAITSVSYIERALAFLPVGTILDGELVDLDSADRFGGFNRAASIAARYAGDWQHRPTADDPPLTYAIFDMLSMGDESIVGETLEARRAVLETALGYAAEGAPLLRVEGREPTADMVDALVAEGYEGVVVKRLDSKYVGGRSPQWVKVKPDQTVDAVCTGTYDAEPGSHLAGHAVGGITFTVTHDDGTVYDGKCAGRMSVALKQELYRNPEKYVGRVVEIGHWAVGDEGALRHPQFHRFRDPADKTASEAVEPAPKRAPRKAAAVPVDRPKRMRNYGAMKDEKLLRVLAELEDGGDAWQRADEPERDLAVVNGLIAERGI